MNSVLNMPADLLDVLDRIASGQRVYGFELELLATFISS